MEPSTKRRKLDNRFCVDDDDVPGLSLLVAQGHFLELDDLPAIVHFTKTQPEISEDDFLALNDLQVLEVPVNGRLQAKVDQNISLELEDIMETGLSVIFAQGNFLELDDLPAIVPSTKMRAKIVEDDFLELDDLKVLDVTINGRLQSELDHSSTLELEHIMGRGISLLFARGDLLELADLPRIVPSSKMRAEIAEDDFLELDGLQVPDVPSNGRLLSESDQNSALELEDIMGGGPTLVFAQGDFLELDDLPAIVRSTKMRAEIDEGDFLELDDLEVQEMPVTGRLQPKLDQNSSLEMEDIMGTGSSLLIAQGDLLELDDPPRIVLSSKMRAEIAQDDFLEWDDLKVLNVPINGRLQSELNQNRALELEDIMGRGFVYNHISATIAAKLNQSQSGKEEAQVPQLYWFFSTICLLVNFVPTASASPATSSTSTETFRSISVTECYAASNVLCLVEANVGSSVDNFIFSLVGILCISFVFRINDECKHSCFPSLVYSSLVTVKETAFVCGYWIVLSGSLEFQYECPVLSQQFNVQLICHISIYGFML